VEKVLLTLAKAGFEATLAGGSVRDALLGHSLKDFDVATSAHPDKVEELFSSTLAVGKAFGTIVVVENGHNFEVTTFRAEDGYADGRHPSHVQFSTMEEDSKRRDFTVNAIYYDPVAEMIFDFHGGLDDLAAKTLRTVGNAEERFSEDHLRMLRGARFVSQLGFELERGTFEAIKKLHGKIQSVSAERVLNEMQRLLAGSYIRLGLQVLLDTRMVIEVWPGIQNLNLDRLKFFLPFQSWENAFAALSFLANTDPEGRIRAWKGSRDSLKLVKNQIDSARILLDPKSTKAQRIQALGGADFAQTLILVAGLLAEKGEMPKLDGWIQEYLEVAGSSGELPKPFLTGEDLMKQGVPQSPKLGEMLKALYQAQLEGRIKNRDEALRAAKSMGG
jgi:tRNA nucleotidyltransferase (CCA-adding enzyme)